MCQKKEAVGDSLTTTNIFKNAIASVRHNSPVSFSVQGSQMKTNFQRVPEIPTLRRMFSIISIHLNRKINTNWLTHDKPIPFNNNQFPCINAHLHEPLSHKSDFSVSYEILLNIMKNQIVVVIVSPFDTHISEYYIQQIGMITIL